MNKNFIYLWISQILSQVTVNLMNFLLLTRLFTLTGSSIATSFLWISFSVPAIFFGPIGAASVDFISRRKTLIVTNLLQAIIVFIYFNSHESSVFLLFFIVFLYSCLNQFYVPAENAILPSVSTKKFLPKANSLFFITQQASLVVGFGFAGLIQKWLGFTGSILLCSILLFVAYLSALMLPEFKLNKPIPKTFEKAFYAFFESIFEGYKFIKNRKLILYSLSLILGIQVGLAIIVANMPAIASELLNISTNYIGLIMVIPAAFGALVGSFFISKTLSNDYRKKTVIEYGLILLGVSVLLLSFKVLWFSVPLVFLIGLGFVLVNIPSITFLQEITPNWFRGRVFGNMWFLVTLCTIFPVLFSGVVSEFFGVQVIFILLGLLSLWAFYFVKKNGQKILTDNWS